MSDYGFEIFDFIVHGGLRDNRRVGEVVFSSSLRSVKQASFSQLF